MAEYHLRRVERSIEDREELMDVLRKVTHMTLALSKADEPYLVTVNYSFDEANMRVYFHCASAGKKIDILRSNPRVWGQVLEDLGYIQGECDHSFRTVQFSGNAEFASDISEKKHALELMIDRLEKTPETIKKDSLTKDKIEKVVICKIVVEGMSGKHNIVHSADKPE
jgi:nitroimidazol reductase NimA-like FMN-containing flavoprotein (pyridoxamine 5'-phosphate oxidase superfamily)